MSLSLPFPCPISVTGNLSLGLECLVAMGFGPAEDRHLPAVTQACNVYTRSVPHLLWILLWYLLLDAVTYL